MPSIRSIGPYRFFFYSSVGGEPPHVHVERDRHRAKLWLEPVRVEWSRRFGARELERIRRLVSANRTELMEAWNAFFSP